MATQQPPEGELVLVQLSDGNRGDHRIVGAATRSEYGYRKDGDQFYAAAADVRKMPALQPVTERAEAVVEPEQEEPPPPPPPPFDLTEIWGIDEERAEALRERGVRSPNGILAMGENRLSEIMPKSTAARVITEVEKLLEESK